MQSSVLTIVVAVALIIGAVIAIPVMNRRRYGSGNADRHQPETRKQDPDRRAGD